MTPQESNKRPTNTTQAYREQQGALFAFLAASHPFRPLLGRFEQSLSANARVALEETGATRTVHADLKGQPEGENGFRIEAFYWSRQTRDERGFRAATLSFSAKKGEAEWLEFPADPYLSALAPYLAARDVEGGAPVDILRYVPLRRVTFRAGEVSGTPAVGKFKRRSRFRQAYELLQTVHRTLTRASPGFRVSAPIAMEEECSLYFQEALPGRTLADMIDASQSARFLVRLGGLHAALHRAPVNGLSCWDRHAFLESLRRDARWIAFLLPERAAGVGRALQRIEAAAAAGLKKKRLRHFVTAFCHGDPDCTQVLVDGEDWSLLDFDGCQAGDPIATSPCSSPRSTTRERLQLLLQCFILVWKLNRALARMTFCRMSRALLVQMNGLGSVL